MESARGCGDDHERDDGLIYDSRASALVAVAVTNLVTTMTPPPVVVVTTRL